MNRNLGIIIFLLFISIVAMWMFPSVQESYKVRTIRTLLRQSARWALASQQDNSPLIALLHANYGAGYLWALNDIATSQEIERIGNVRYLDFIKKIVTIQDKATQKVSKVCPNFIGKVDPQLLKWSGNKE